MIEYQEVVTAVFKNYRPFPRHPVYPPYHRGDYLEDFFFKRFSEKNNLPPGKKLSRIFIPVSWTTCYIDGRTAGLQKLINGLDPGYQYFTVAQHDEAVREKLPPETLSFNAGGLAGGIPIPLICSPIPENLKENQERDIFCSFVGSVTHQIRKKMYDQLKTNSNYKILTKLSWTFEISKYEMETFIGTASRSVFSLCPRGYGKSSYRLYEVMQLGSIPVCIYDQEWFPFSGELDWDDFCIRVPEDQIPGIDDILTEITPKRVKKLQDNIPKIYRENFTLEKVYQKIISKLLN
jgi:hypothetical protein